MSNDGSIVWECQRLKADNMLLNKVKVTECVTRCACEVVGVGWGLLWLVSDRGGVRVTEVFQGWAPRLELCVCSERQTPFRRLVYQDTHHFISIANYIWFISIISLLAPHNQLLMQCCLRAWQQTGTNKNQDDSHSVRQHELFVSNKVHIYEHVTELISCSRGSLDIITNIQHTFLTCFFYVWYKIYHKSYVHENLMVNHNAYIL